MIGKQTTLDLNGPILSFATNSQSATICPGTAVTFTGFATAFFPVQTPINSASPTGIITYRWYDQNGPLFDDADRLLISGAGTSTLTLFNNQFSRNLYLTAEYLPSAYGLPGVAVTVGSARSTGNAINEPVNSETFNLNIIPNLQITSEPLDRLVNPNINAVFSTEASLTDGTKSSLSYQWQLNGQDVSDGTYQVGTATKPSSAILTVIDDVTGNQTQVKFSEITSYSNFSAGKTYTIRSNINFRCKIFANGAGGSGSTYYNPRTDDTYSRVLGSAGGIAQGEFTFIEGKNYKLLVGSKGTESGKGGFGGGGDVINQSLSSGRIGTYLAGPSGGGYTGLFDSIISHSNSILIAGGGGGVLGTKTYTSIDNDSLTDAPIGNGGGTTGETSLGGTQTSGGASNFSTTLPYIGSALKGGTGFGNYYSTARLVILNAAGTGGGGGYYGGGGSQSQRSNNNAYTSPSERYSTNKNGGGGSGYLHSTLITNGSFSVGTNYEQDGSFRIESIPETFTVNVIVSGSRTPNLTISSNAGGLHTVRCRVSSSISCNSPISTTTANLTVVAATERAIINFETYGGSSTAILGSVNLATSTYTHTNPTSAYPVLGFYAPERDVNLELEIYAAKGSDNGSYRGGEGGVSKIRFTARQNEEYVIAPLPQANQGGAVYIYRKAALIAAVGSGGDAGSGGNGGPGGGINVSGGDGGGRGAGRGGQLFSAGSLPFPGIFGSSSGNVPTVSGDTRASAPDGGRVLPCARGDYWRNLGYGACDNLGNVQFFWFDGTRATNSATISRGHKIGYGIRQTAGARIGSGGNGGQGATGGQGGTDVGGGGGGSGYTDGSVTVVSTQQGGSTGSARVIFRFVP